MAAVIRAELDDAQLYRRFLERNPEFDGQFVTGVLTTGIYCLPSCPARRPKPENVRFFRTPDEARSFGLRPCHRCRPDALYRGEAWAESMFERTAERVRREPAAFGDIAAVARAAGISRTALNGLFQEHAHESAGVFLRRTRIDKAQELLRVGAAPAIAMGESGFKSASAFHAQFLAKTGLTPAAFSRVGQEFTIRLPARYRTREALDFNGRDPASLSEAISDGGFRKCALIRGKPAVIEIGFRSGAAVCRTDATDPYAAHQIALRMLGFETDPSAFERLHEADVLFGPVIRRQAGVRVPLAADGWEALAWAVIGQQISLAAAVRLRREMIAAFGSPHASGMVAHPSAAVIADLEPSALTRLRFPEFKAEYVIAAACAVASGQVCLERTRSARRLAREMRRVRGIGPWTIEYTLLRGVGLNDCLPASDAGLARGIERISGSRPNEKAVGEMMARFAPYRSLATYHVWQSLSRTG